MVMAALAHVRVVLLAGGKGERFWPRSTTDIPKQFLPMAGNKSLLRNTFDRIAGFVPVASIYVTTGARYGGLTRQELPELPAENLILEPEGRDTAPSLGLASLWVEQVDPDAIMVALPADHHIIGEGKFRATLAAAVAAAADGGLVTLGVHPTRPETGYGYIQVGDAVGEHRGLPVHRALRFVEKPDARTAERYLASGDYLWNSGMFVWKVSSLRREIARHLPELHAVLEELAAAGDLEAMRAALPEVFRRAPKISIDYGVMEKSDQVYVVPAYFGWDDVGSWSAVERLRPRDEQGNCLTGDVVAYDSRNLIVEGGRRVIATVGVSDLIVVDTDEALLVCHKSRAQDVKKVAALAAPFTHPGAPPAALPQPEGQVVEKPWGREIWWAVTDQYVGKLLEVRAGQSLSLQYHERKLETMFFQSGQARLRLGEEWLDAGPGKVVTIPPGTVHQLVAVTDVRVIEVSTPHLDDVIRLSDRYGRAPAAVTEAAAAREPGRSGEAEGEGQ